MGEKLKPYKESEASKNFRSIVGLTIELSKEFAKKSKKYIKNINLKRNFDDENIDFTKSTNIGSFALGAYDTKVDVILMPSTPDGKKLTLILFRAKKIKYPCSDGVCDTGVIQSGIEYAIFDKVIIDENNKVSTWDSIDYGNDAELVFKDNNTILDFIINSQPKHFAVKNHNFFQEYYVDHRDFIRNTIIPMIKDAHAPFTRHSPSIGGLPATRL